MSLIPEIKELLHNVAIEGTLHNLNEYKAMNNDANYSFAYLLNAIGEKLICGEVAIKHLKKSHTPNAYASLAHYYDYVEDYVNAFKYYEMCNDKFQMGYYYYWGLGVDIDLKKAYEYIQSSKKNAWSLCLIGSYYEYDYESIDIKQDIKKAYECYIESAKYGNDVALCKIGIAYINGGIIYVDHNGQEVDVDYTEDPIKGFEYLTLSAEANNILGMRYLASYYYDGHCTKQDYKKALEWYTRLQKYDNNNDDMDVPYRATTRIPICESKLMELYKALCSEEDYTFAYDLYTKHKDPYANVLQNHFRNTYGPYLIYFVKDIADIILTCLF